MAIKIELAELQRITSRTQDVNTELTSELTKMSSELQKICENVQSSELTSANNNLTQSINEVAEKVKTNLPRIIEFLTTQRTAYEQTNATTKTQIDSLVSSIQSSFGSK